MPESEETKLAPEQESFSVVEEKIPAVEIPKDSEPSSENQSTKEEASPEISPEAGLITEESSQPSSSQKVELKKHVLSAAHASAAHAVQSVLACSEKEVAANLPEVAIEVEIDFILDRKRISLTALNALTEGEVFTLSGADFKTTLFLQEKAIAEAALVLVDQRPSIQITKIFKSCP